MIAAKRIGEKYHESDSDSIAMIVLESDKPLGDAGAPGITTVWSESCKPIPSTCSMSRTCGETRRLHAGVQSRDGKAAYVELNLAGNQGSTLGNESVKAVREIVAKSAPPNGLKAYTTGPAALNTDMNEAADKSMLKMMGVTGAVIMIMLFIAYRSISTVLLVLVMVGFWMGLRRWLVPRFSGTTTCWGFRHSSSRCCRRWRSRQEPITRYSS